MKSAVIFLLFAAVAFKATAAPAEEAVVQKVEVKEEPKPEAAEEAPEEQVVEAAPFNFCPNGWFFHGSQCFLLVRNSMTWFSAEEHCNSHGGHLASVTNPTEHSFLQQMLQTAGQSYAWLGGFYLQDRWLWIDGQGMYYTKWSSQSSPHSTYACMNMRSTNGWVNNRCTNSNIFICSKNPFSC
ncbi:hypothetical protein WMY93_006472 [Mugilogobius chulae]|uniref:C-type lectin domain-containing protein n=1 Tax=Mugilogobius chulae TaxID=88201 RepID=A0AAW0PTM4_9GOBI